MKIEYIVPFDAPDVRAFARVPRQTGLRRAAKVLAFMFVLGCVALVVVPWQQTAYGDGEVVAYSPSDRPQPIAAPVAGRIAEWHVTEGTRVHAGDPIVRVVDVDPDLLDRLRTERSALAAREEATRAAVETAGLNVRRQGQLAREGLSARRVYEEALLRQATAKKELADARAALAQLETRLARQDVQLVRAPRDGIIARRIEGQGALLVKQGDELATLVPIDVSPAVELWIDGNDLPLVMAGDHVRLQFEGWPALQFSGWPSVAVGTFGGRVNVIDPAEVGRPGKFRILVRPAPDERWPAPRILRQGVRAHGWVLLRSVPLGYELWRRFNDFPPSRPEGAAAEGGAWPTSKPL